MKKLLSLLSVLTLIFVWSCQSSDIKTTAGTETATKTASVSVDGTYVFDTNSWKQAMIKLDPNFTKAPPEMITKITSAFTKFSMVVKGKNVTANFGTIVMEGTLKELSKTNNVVSYKLVPNKPEQQKETIVIKITDGNKMVAGPDGNPKQLLYFSKK